MTQPRHGLFLIVTVLAAAALLVVGVVSPRIAAAGWLIAFIFLSSIPLGALAWLMISRLTGGYWGESLRPTLEGAAATIPLLGILFIPVLVALPLLYPWVAGSDAIKADVANLYLNIPLFVIARRHRLGWLDRARSCVAQKGRPWRTPVRGRRPHLPRADGEPALGRLDTVGRTGLHLHLVRRHRCDHANAGRRSRSRLCSRPISTTA